MYAFAICVVYMSQSGLFLETMTGASLFVDSDSSRCFDFSNDKSDGLCDLEIVVSGKCRGASL